MSFGDEIFTGPELSAIWVLCLLAPSLIAKACNFKPPPVRIFSKFNFKSASMKYRMASLTFRTRTFSTATYIHDLNLSMEDQVCFVACFDIRRKKNTSRKALGVWVLPWTSSWTHTHQPELWLHKGWLPEKIS